MNHEEINKLFDKWNEALQTGNPDVVASLYAENAVLLPTVSNRVRTDYEGIKDYFVRFQAKKPTGQINESHTRFFANIAVNSGVYTFRFEDNSAVRARFTYVYELIDREWLIIEHHSSKMPED